MVATGITRRNSTWKAGFVRPFSSISTKRRPRCMAERSRAQDDRALSAHGIQSFTTFPTYRGLMNRLLTLASSIIAVSFPGASAADDRLDAPGPGYREQVERFAPRRGQANPFQLQIGSTLFSVESPMIVRTSELFSNTVISAPGALFEADRLEVPDPDYREQIERATPRGQTNYFHLQIDLALPSVEFLGTDRTSEFIRPGTGAAESSSRMAPVNTSEFSQPIRLFEIPRVFGLGLAPSESTPAPAKKSP